MIHFQSTSLCYKYHTLLEIKQAFDQTRIYTWWYVNGEMLCSFQGIYPGMVCCIF